jgi:hypothetical protein
VSLWPAMPPRIEGEATRTLGVSRTAPANPTAARMVRNDRLGLLS